VVSKRKKPWEVKVRLLVKVLFTFQWLDRIVLPAIRVELVRYFVVLL